VDKLVSDIEKDKEEFDGTVYKRKIKDGVWVVDKVVIHDNKNIHTKEFKKGNKNEV